MHKKSQGLSISVIILAALGLMVLIIMVLIFTGQINIFTKNIGCTARNGECMAPSTSCPPEKPTIIYTQDCSLIEDETDTEKKPGQCCISLT